MYTLYCILLSMSLAPDILTYTMPKIEPANCINTVYHINVRTNRVGTAHIITHNIKLMYTQSHTLLSEQFNELLFS